MSSPLKNNRLSEVIKDIHERVPRDRPSVSRQHGRIGNQPHRRLRRHSVLAYHTGKFVRGTVGRGARLVMLLIGSVFVLVGMLLGLTIIGSICGLPLILIGVVLFVRGLV